MTVGGDANLPFRPISVGNSACRLLVRPHNLMLLLSVRGFCSMQRWVEPPSPNDLGESVMQTNCIWNRFFSFSFSPYPHLAPFGPVGHRACTRKWLRLYPYITGEDM